MKRTLAYLGTLAIVCPYVCPSVCSAVCSIRAQDAATPAATVDFAQSLAKDGERSLAITVISEALAQEDEWETQALFAFTLGWLYEDLARNVDGEEREEALEESVEQYRDVLEAYPGHPQTSDNLVRVLTTLERKDAAIEVLQAVSSERGEDEHTYARHVKAGDLLREVGEPQRALRSYQIAYESDPEEITAPLRIVSLHEELPEDNLRRLYRSAERFPPQIATPAYEVVIRRAGTSPEIGRPALLAWLELESRAGTFSRGSLERVRPGEGDPDPVLQELILAAENPVEGIPRFDYWASSGEPRHVAALAMTCLAKRYTVSRPDVAARVYNLALRLAPGFDQYDEDPALKGRSIAGLDIALDLARLYHVHGGREGVQTGDENFELLRDDLLIDKNLAYAEGDLPAIEKFHTVLGLIYAERGAWAEGDWHAAPYHLERAVTTAKLIRKTEASPLPNISRVLAKGLAEKGDVDRARVFFLDAVEGYIEKGDARGAKSTLDAAEERVGTGGLPSYGEIDAAIEKVDPGRLKAIDPGGTRIRRQ